jgi:hypothetical protein
MTGNPGKNERLEGSREVGGKESHYACSKDVEEGEEERRRRSPASLGIGS